jgi:multidrug efflux system membrane fusion protein
LRGGGLSDEDFRLMHASGVLRLVALVFSLAATAACAGGQAEGTVERRGGERPPTPVAVAPVERKAMPVELRVIGRVEATNVGVRSQITGELVSVNFKEGDDVTKGQVLFEIDRRPLEAVLRQAEANLARDLAQAAHAEAQTRRYEDLAARGIATKEQVDTSRTSAEALRATLGADRAAVENATLQLQYATIVAPTSGRTGELVVYPGNLIRALDQTPLVVINKVTPIDVGFGIPESQLPALKQFMARGPLAVEAATSDTDTRPPVGRVTFVDNAVDSTTGTIKIKATYPNDDRRLWPGQFVNVSVKLATERDATVVPSVAVQTGQQGQYVFVVKPDQTVEMRPVVVVRTHTTESVVAGSLESGEVVVTDGHLRLVPGARISIRGDTKDAQGGVPGAGERPAS